MDTIITRRQLLINASRLAAALALYPLPNGAKDAVLDATANAQQVVRAKLGLSAFSGPYDIELDTNLWYKLKAGKMSDPDRGDFGYLGRTVAKQLQERLKSTFGEDVVYTKRGADDDGDYVSSTKCPKYVLRGTLDSVRFQGNIILGPWYSINCSARLIARDGGAVVWSMKDKQFQKIYKTIKGAEVSDVFGEVIGPKIVDYIAPRVIEAIKS